MQNLTTGQIAKSLGVAPRTVANMIDTGVLQGHKLPGSRHRRVTATDFLAFAKRLNLPQESVAEIFAAPVTKGAVAAHV